MMSSITLSEQYVTIKLCTWTNCKNKGQCFQWKGLISHLFDKIHTFDTINLHYTGSNCDSYRSYGADRKWLNRLCKHHALARAFSFLYVYNSLQQYVLFICSLFYFIKHCLIMSKEFLEGINVQTSCSGKNMFVFDWYVIMWCMNRLFFIVTSGLLKLFQVE